MIKNRTFTIGFIGLGLIGGSIAKSIRRIFPNYNIIAYDNDKVALNEAFSDGTLSSVCNAVDNSFSDCDYIFLCTPVHYNIEYLKTLKTIISPSCILTDVGSVKGDICKAVKQIGLDTQFIGGHPMVGSEHSGYTYSSDRLIEQAYYFLTPSPTVNKTDVDKFTTFIDELGAITINYSSSEHDIATASISHIPHIIAAEIVNLVRKSDNEAGILKQLAAGGFKDITRIASSSPTVWEHICLSNKENIANQLGNFVNDLNEVITAINKDDASYLHDFFSNSRDYRDSIPNNAVGVIRKTYEVYVDIIDVPGALASVVNIIAANNINIKNIGITHNREYEEGVLRIALYSDFDANKVKELLSINNFKIYER